MNHVARGNTAELLVMYKASEQGFSVFLPITHDNRCDLILSNGSLFKIQVKRVYSATHLSGAIQQRVEGCRILNRRKDGRVWAEKYLKGDYDYLAAACPKTNNVWLIPFDVANKYSRQVHLGKSLEIYKNNFDLK